MPMLLCDEADVRQRVDSFVHADVLAKLADAHAFLVGEEGSSNGAGLITRWSTQFESDVGYSIALRTETVTLSGSGSNQLILKRKYTPIQVIHSISYPDVGGAVTSYDFDKASGIIWLKKEASSQLEPIGTYGTGRLDLPIWPRGRSNIQVKLRYGHEVVPSEVRKAVADRGAADVLLHDRGYRDKGLKSKSLGDRSESYGDGRWSEEIVEYIKAYSETVRLLTSEVAV